MFPGVLNAPSESAIGSTRLVTSRSTTFAAAVGDAGRGPEISLIKLHGPPKHGRSVTFVVQAILSPDLNALGYAPGIPVGILRFGNGGGLAQLEFDIPSGNTHDPTNPSNKGIAFTVPAGNIELLARDDSKVIPKAGMGYPSDVGGSMISAYATYGALEAEAHFQRTQIFAFKGSATGLPAGQTSSRMSVPPFVRAFSLYRKPARGLTIRLGTTIGGVATVLDEIPVLNNVALTNPVLIPPRCSYIEIVNGSDGEIEYGQLLAGPIRVINRLPAPPSIVDITLGAGTGTFVVGSDYPTNPGSICSDIGHSGLGRPQFRIDFGSALIDASTITATSVTLKENSGAGAAIACTRDLLNNSIVRIRPNANIMDGEVTPIRLEVTTELKDTSGQSASPITWDFGFQGCA